MVACRDWEGLQDLLEIASYAWQFWTLGVQVPEWCCGKFRARRVREVMWLPQPLRVWSLKGPMVDLGSICLLNIRLTLCSMLVPSGLDLGKATESLSPGSLQAGLRILQGSLRVHGTAIRSPAWCFAQCERRRPRSSARVPDSTILYSTIV